MRKLFTLVCASLFATALFAETEKNPSDPASVTTDQALSGISYTIPAAQIAGGGSKIIGDMWDKGVKVRTNKKYGDISNALPFVVNEGKQINGIKIVGVTNAETELTFTSVIIDGATQSLSGSLPNKNSSTSGTVEVKDIEAKESVIFITSGANQALICYEITYDDATPSSEPVLKVSTDSVALNASIKVPAPSAELVFSGKNLAAGQYQLVLPNLVGLSASPAYVVVDENGKLNDTVSLSFAPEANVEAGETKITLTIGELTKEVKVAYSANFDESYQYATSVNIEQWVMDNGKQTEAFKAVLESAHIEFENINELDSLNSDPSKPNCNEPFLGLKLKKTGAYVALWLKQGSTIRVKFGKVNDPVIGSINGQEQTFTPADLEQPLEVTAQIDSYMMLTTTTDKTIVLKQVMIDEPIAEVELPECNQEQGFDEIKVEKSTKFIENGHLYIELNGVRYDAQGTVVK